MSVFSTRLTSLGLVCPLGDHPDQILDRLLTGQRGLVRRGDCIPGREIMVGAVNTELLSVDTQPKHFQSRNNRLALTAYQQIAADLERLTQDIDRSRIAVVIGTSTSGISDGELAVGQRLTGHEFPTAYCYQQQELGNSAEFIAHLSAATGPVLTISTACTSSAKALVSAQQLLKNDLADVVICGGVDSLSRLTTNGFFALESLSDDACNPFSQHRNGINIGEAAALFIMTREPGGTRLQGYGESSDAHHISAPHPQGVGAIASMRKALQKADISAEQIDYINLHGTATRQNDAMEAIAVNDLFHNPVLCSSTKALTGHTLGTAGALEAAFCWLLLSDRNHQHRIPMQVSDSPIDENLAKINLATALSHQPEQLRYILSNSFAFGGNNISLILGKV